MTFGGVFAQYAGDGGAELDRALRNLLGTVLGFALVIVFALWLMHRSRADRSERPPVSGWYADPWGGPYERWWNGDTWTGNVRPAPYQGWDANPVPTGPAAGAAGGGAPPFGPPPDGPTPWAGPDQAPADRTGHGRPPG